MKPIILAGVALATLAGTPVRAAEPDAAERRTPAEIAADKDREILVEDGATRCSPAPRPIRH